MKKVFMVANAGFTLTNFRRDIILKLNKLGHHVTLLCPFDPQLDPFFKEAIKELNVDHFEIPLNRKGLNPIKDFSLFLKLLSIFKKEKPDVVLNYTIKPVIYSSIAAYFSDIKSINSFITGLGHVFTSTSIKARALKDLVSFLYKISLKLNSHVFFQNPDDLNIFVENNLVSKDKAIITNGSGVNLEVFKYSGEAKVPRSFIFIGRLLRDKGILELVEAIKRAKKEKLDCKFYVCGALDKLNPAAIAQEDLGKLLEEKLFEYIPHTNDVPKLLADKEVFILPSYREGTPRSTLEAMAMGLPIITTDAPGCRETVQHNVNGFLVPTGDSSSIYEHIKFYVENPSKVVEMGNQSTLFAKKKYDVNKVNQEILSKIGII